ncbi:MAG: sensor histidine kinase [Marinilabiliales bacterium]|nr:sensor histidine kinase [Marinilabiliales bacterium]
MKNIALHIYDLVENSTRARASHVTILVREEPVGDSYCLEIVDDGRGMTPEVLRKATDPFYTSRTTRKVGLGLPLIRMNAERTGGSFTLTSAPGSGTRLEAYFVMSHPDRLPLGEIDDVLLMLTNSYPNLHLVYEHTTPKGKYRYDSEEIREAIGDLLASSKEVRDYVREMISDNLKAIGAEP